MNTCPEVASTRDRAGPRGRERRDKGSRSSNMEVILVG